MCGGAPRELPVSSPRAAAAQRGSVPMGHAAALPWPRCALAPSLTGMDGACRSCPGQGQLVCIRDEGGWEAAGEAGGAFSGELAQEAVCGCRRWEPGPSRGTDGDGAGSTIMGCRCKVPGFPIHRRLRHPAKPERSELHRAPPQLPIPAPCQEPSSRGCPWPCESIRPQG